MIVIHTALRITIWKLQIWAISMLMFNVEESVFNTVYVCSIFIVRYSQSMVSKIKTEIITQGHMPEPWESNSLRKTTHSIAEHLWVPMKGQSMCETWEDILKNHVPPFDWGYPVNPKFAIIFSCPREHSLNTHKRNSNFKEVQRKTEYDTLKRDFKLTSRE